MSPAEEAWVERFVVYLSPEIPPVTARVLGWLMICEPAEQSPAQIAKATGASLASMTSSLRLLTMAGFVSKLTRPGDRQAYYHVKDGAWAQVVERQISSIETFRAIASDGIGLTNGEAGAARLQGALAVFDWMAAVFANAPPLPASRKKP